MVDFFFFVIFHFLSTLKDLQLSKPVHSGAKFNASNPVLAQKRPNARARGRNPHCNREMTC